MTHCGRSALASDVVVPDCSLFGHGWLPSQYTVTAEHAVAELAQRRLRRVSSLTLYLEFPSLLRKLVNRRQMASADARDLHERLLGLTIDIVPIDDALLRRAWDIATDLGQSDTFDALGYATAEAYDAEFWTCDRRFANAAAGRDYPRLRFIP